MIFHLSNISHCRFEFVNNPTIAITQLLQQQIELANVRFIHDNSEFAPSASVQVSDGELRSSVTSIGISFERPTNIVQANDNIPIIAGATAGG